MLTINPSGFWYHNIHHPRTVLLRRGADQLSWTMAARTAMGMSMVSMLAMEVAENSIDYHLTGGSLIRGPENFGRRRVVIGLGIWLIAI